jgi:hypothetical protein
MLHRTNIKGARFQYLMRLAIAMIIASSAVQTWPGQKLMAFGRIEARCTCPLLMVLAAHFLQDTGWGARLELSASPSRPEFDWRLLGLVI